MSTKTKLSKAELLKVQHLLGRQPVTNVKLPGKDRKGSPPTCEQQPNESCRSRCATSKTAPQKGSAATTAEQAVRTPETLYCKHKCMNCASEQFAPVRLDEKPLTVLCRNCGQMFETIIHQDINKSGTDRFKLVVTSVRTLIMVPKGEQIHGVKGVVLHRPPDAVEPSQRTTKFPAAYKGPAFPLESIPAKRRKAIEKRINGPIDKLTSGGAGMCLGAVILKQRMLRQQEADKANQKEKKDAKSRAVQRPRGGTRGGKRKAG